MTIEHLEVLRILLVSYPSALEVIIRPDNGYAWWIQANRDGWRGIAIHIDDGATGWFYTQYNSDELHDIFDNTKGDLFRYLTNFE